MGDLGVVDWRGEAIWLPSLRAGLWKPIAGWGPNGVPVGAWRLKGLPPKDGLLMVSG